MLFYNDTIVFVGINFRSRTACSSDGEDESYSSSYAHFGIHEEMLKVRSCRINFLNDTRLTVNRPRPISKNPQSQNEAKCTTFLVKISFICMRMKNYFHIKGWALNLVLIQTPGGSRKWPVIKIEPYYTCGEL